MRYICLIFLFLFFFFPSVYSSSNYRVVKEGINIRVDSTPMSSAIGLLQKNEAVEVLEERFDWYKIRLPKRFSCYVSAEFLEEAGPHKGKVIASSLNLRIEPSLQSYVVGRVKGGNSLSIIEKKNSWFKVKGYPHAFGWVNKNFLKREKIFTEEGVVVPLTKRHCKANFLLRGKGKYPLYIRYKNYKKFMNKKVKVMGRKVNDGCAYLLVEKLSFKK